MSPDSCLDLTTQNFSNLDLIPFYQQICQVVPEPSCTKWHRRSLSTQTLSFVPGLAPSHSPPVPRLPFRKRDQAALRAPDLTRCFRFAMAVVVTTREPAKPVTARRSLRRFLSTRHHSRLVASRELGTRFLVVWVPVRSHPEVGRVYCECLSGTRH